MLHCSLLNILPIWNVSPLHGSPSTRRRDCILVIPFFALQFFLCLFTCMSTASLSSITVFLNAYIPSSLDCLLLSGSSCQFYPCFLSRLASKLRYSTLISCKLLLFVHAGGHISSSPVQSCWLLTGDPFHSPKSLQAGLLTIQLFPCCTYTVGFFSLPNCRTFIYPCQIASYFYQDTTSLRGSLGILLRSVNACQLLTPWCYLQIDKAFCHLGLYWQYQIPWGLEQINAEP